MSDDGASMASKYSTVSANQVLLAAEGAVTGGIKNPNANKSTPPSRSSTGKMSDVPLNEPAADANHGAKEPDAVLRWRRVTDKEYGYLRVVRIGGEHFAAAGRAAEEEELTGVGPVGDMEMAAMEEGQVGKSKSMDAASTTGDDKLWGEDDLGKTAASGYASFKKLGGSFCMKAGELLGGFQSGKKKTFWEWVWTAILILFGWLLTVLATIGSETKAWVKANKYHFISLIVIAIVALARGVNPWAVVLKFIDSFKPNKVSA
ncbi:hypothetical protein CALVIDRAFT_564868 [Calocera viscosa TUFC12733]|uniref:Uncharacterized protein n=1 Tax=Calocera viscosa (strain TUFC12733) TaxID=1330018 RepID=A0A167L9I4_CALVF|nr:hypothetical protein CALVIDRAFT_564868 [Calocera viscosa TUFC12733]